MRGWGDGNWNSSLDFPAHAPLPTAWIDDHEVLQKKILTAMRLIGMKPVLPAFGGWVPTALMALYPHANISRVGKPPLCANGTLGDRYGCPAMVDAEDQLFLQLGKGWMTQLNETYGTGDHMFGADGFFSTIHAPWASLGTEQSKKSAALEDVTSARSYELLLNQPVAWWAAHAKGAYAAMSSSDPDAVWVYQSYPWHQFIVSTMRVTKQPEFLK